MKKVEYLGFLSGTIYLQEDNIIHDILDEHFATDGSYVWVVDNKGMLVYHPDPKRIGKSIIGNKVVHKKYYDIKAVHKMLQTLKVRRFLAGYTYIKSSRVGSCFPNAL